MGELKERVTLLYTGWSRLSVRFRYALFLFDLATVIYFIVTTPLPDTPITHAINAVLAVIILLDFVARLWIAPNRWEHLCQIYVIADAVVLLAMVAHPFTAIDLNFLRILRGLRLGHSGYLLRDLRRDSPVFRAHEAPIVASLNLLVFVFVTTSGVFSLFAGTAAGYQGYVDALYFTVTTLTTTGYGDITPETTFGKLVSVAIMVVGVSLFLRLVAAVFRPSRIHHRCPKCGLSKHDADAVHCKHCGETIHIETEGFT